MQQILAQIPDILQLVSILVTLIVLIASIGVRFTKTKADDLFVENAATKVFKAIAWLPTIGVNPRTKALEDFYNEQKKLNAEKDAAKAASEQKPA